MFYKKRKLIIGLFICLIGGHGAAADSVSPLMNNQTEQDKARQNALAPPVRDYQSSHDNTHKQTLFFPPEENCWPIKQFIITSTDKKLTARLLGKISDQIPGRCLGIKGIRLLSAALQNELITQGYITSLIDIPSQSLVEGTLTLTLSYGKIGKIIHSPDSDVKKTLWNTLPTKTGKTLRLTDLEQGMANLQRLPGATAKMKIQPGRLEAESDIEITYNLAKRWQVGAWMDDAGSRASGRYQAGAAFYLYDITSLSDILYWSSGGDIEHNRQHSGNKNHSLYYAIPFGYWSVSFYGSRSEYRQLFKGNWSQIDYKSKNQYYSATLSRLWSHTRSQKTTLDLRVAKSASRYYFGGEELAVMRRQNPIWELTLRHQHYLDRAMVNASLGVQRSFPWLSSTHTPIEKAGLYSGLSRVVHANLQALMKFGLTGDKFSYAPHLNAQFSPDILSTDNQFNIGNRWTVRGFDGENTLSGNQGWYWRNDFIWDIPTPDRQFYLGADIGKIIGGDMHRQGSVISGAVSGIRGQLFTTQYDFFIGTPLKRPKRFPSNSLNLGFSLQWRY